MKTKLLFLAAIFAASFQSSKAQCSRTATMSPTADPTNYPVTGTANLTFYADNTKEITFNSDFITVQGLDLRVFLSSNPFINTGGNDLEITTSTLIDDNGNPGGNAYLGNPLTGAKTFTVPSTVAFDQYDYIIIQCVVANAQWGRANLPAAANANGPECGAVLSVEENNLLSSISFYPNPIHDILEISNNKQLDLNLSIYNILGEQVHHVNNLSLRKQTLNLSSLKSGVYLVQIEAYGNTITKKLIKR